MTDHAHELRRYARKIAHPAGHFSVARHRLLVEIEMQPKFSGLTVGKHVTRRLMIELASAGDEE